MAALPKHLSPDRFTRIALTEIRKNPQLGECDPLSFLGAVIQSAQLGLEPGSGLGHAYLIPFWNGKKNIREVQFIPGYRGLIDLARRSGQIESISAHPVYEKDDFEFEYGDNERIYHKPFIGAEEDAGKIRYVYAIAKLKGGGLQREVMSAAQISKIRDRKKQANPVWDSDFDEMARKTVIRRLAKYLPLSPEMAAAIEADDAVFKGESQENWKVLDAAYEPKAAPHDPEKTKTIMAGGVSETALPNNEQQHGASSALSQLNKMIDICQQSDIDVEKTLSIPLSELRLGSPERMLSAVDVLCDVINSKS